MADFVLLEKRLTHSADGHAAAQAIAMLHRLTAAGLLVDDGASLEKSVIVRLVPAKKPRLSLLDINWEDGTVYAAEHLAKQLAEHGLSPDLAAEFFHSMSAVDARFLEEGGNQIHRSTRVPLVEVADNLSNIENAVLRCASRIKAAFVA